MDRPRLLCMTQAASPEERIAALVEADLSLLHSRTVPHLSPTISQELFMYLFANIRLGGQHRGQKVLEPWPHFASTKGSAGNWSPLTFVSSQGSTTLSYRTLSQELCVRPIVKTSCRDSTLSWIRVLELNPSVVLALVTLASRLNPAGLRARDRSERLAHGFSIWTSRSVDGHRNG